MARMYKVSADISEKEKVIGGVLTLAQGLWAAGGLLLTGVIFFSLAKLTSPLFALLVALPPGAALGGFFAFYKKEDLSLLTYLRYKKAFQKKNKRLPNDMAYKKNFVGQMEME